MDGGKNARPGHRELRQPYSSAAQAIGLAIRPLRRFVDFSSIIERTADAAGRLQEAALPTRVRRRRFLKRSRRGRHPPLAP